MYLMHDLIRNTAEFTKLTAEFVKFCLGKLWALLMTLIVKDLNCKGLASYTLTILEAICEKD